MTTVSRVIRSTLLAAVLAMVSLRVPAVGAVDVPARLTDAEFWRLTETFSEPSGTFHSDNFVSNEGRYQLVIPELLTRIKPGGVYLGVGPEQNFTYITAVRPKMAFIVDIRRGNLQEHLLYKALMEMSPDRADFLSKLFSRKRPEGLSKASTVDSLFTAYDAIAPSEELYKANLKAVMAWLTTKHAFRLQEDDPAGIDYIYRNAFFQEGPRLGYALTGRGRLGQTPSYAELMTMRDPTGQQRSYLATEEHFAFVRDLEVRNLIVPVVGNFGGTKALRAVAQYVRERGATISMFYVSNVEQYLRQDGLWSAFCTNVRALPLDASSTFVRSTRGGMGMRGPMGAATPGPGMFTSDLGEMLTETRTCATSASAR